VFARETPPGRQLADKTRCERDSRSTSESLRAARQPAELPLAAASTVDLLGSGSLMLAFTPGHSLGRLSLIARFARARSPSER
jgi:hypothetical protein